MKRTLIAAAMAAAFVAAPAWAQRDTHDEHHAPGAQKSLAPQRDAGQTGGGMMQGGMMGAAAMGQGMMGDGYGAIKLSEEQRAKIAEIRRELAGKQRELMAKMHDQRVDMHDLGSVDEAAARKAYDEMSAARKELFEATLAARSRIAALLTDEQRKQLDEQRKQLGSSSPCHAGGRQS